MQRHAMIMIVHRNTLMLTHRRVACMVSLERQLEINIREKTVIGLRWRVIKSGPIPERELGRPGGTEGPVWWVKWRGRWVCQSPVLGARHPVPEARLSSANAPLQLQPQRSRPRRDTRSLHVLLANDTEYIWKVKSCLIKTLNEKMCARLLLVATSCSQSAGVCLIYLPRSMAEKYIYSLLGKK